MICKEICIVKVISHIAIPWNPSLFGNQTKTAILYIAWCFSLLGSLGPFIPSPIQVDTWRWWMEYTNLKEMLKNIKKIDIYDNGLPMTSFVLTVLMFGLLSPPPMFILLWKWAVFMFEWDYCLWLMVGSVIVWSLVSYLQLKHNSEFRHLRAKKSQANTAPNRLLS